MGTQPPGWTDPKGAKVFKTKRIGIGLIALAISGASTGAAVALPPYTVHIKVPSTVKKGQQFDLKVSGNSANTSVLRVFLANRACAIRASREALRPHAKTIILKQVTGLYTVTKSPRSLTSGTHYVCAYLTGLPPQSFPRAHASATFTTT